MNNKIILVLYTVFIYTIVFSKPQFVIPTKKNCFVGIPFYEKDTIEKNIYRAKKLFNKNNKKEALKIFLKVLKQSKKKKS